MIISVDFFFSINSINAGIFYENDFKIVYIGSG